MCTYEEQEEVGRGGDIQYLRRGRHKVEHGKSVCAQKSCVAWGRRALEHVCTHEAHQSVSKHRNVHNKSSGKEAKVNMCAYSDVHKIVGVLSRRGWMALARFFFSDSDSKVHVTGKRLSSQS